MGKVQSRSTLRRGASIAFIDFVDGNTLMIAESANFHGVLQCEAKYPMKGGYETASGSSSWRRRTQRRHLQAQRSSIIETAFFWSRGDREAIGAVGRFEGLSSTFFSLRGKQRSLYAMPRPLLPSQPRN